MAVKVIAVLGGAEHRGIVDPSFIELRQGQVVMFVDDGVKDGEPIMMKVVGG